MHSHSTEAWANCGSSAPHQQWGAEGEAGEHSGGWCLQIPVGRKPVKPEGSIMAVLAIGFFNGESYWGPLQSRALGTTVSPTAWLISVALTLPSYSSPSLYSSVLLVSRWVKPKSVFYAYPKRLGSSLLTFSSASGMGGCRQNGVILPFLFMRVSLGVFCFAVSLSFLSGLLYSPRAGFVHR